MTVHQLTQPSSFSRKCLNSAQIQSNALKLARSALYIEQFQLAYSSITQITTNAERNGTESQEEYSVTRFRGVFCDGYFKIVVEFIIN